MTVNQLAPPDDPVFQCVPPGFAAKAMELAETLPPGSFPVHRENVWETFAAMMDAYTHWQAHAPADQTLGMKTALIERRAFEDAQVEVPLDPELMPAWGRQIMDLRDGLPYLDEDGRAVFLRELEPPLPQSLYVQPDLQLSAGAWEEFVDE